MYKATCAFLALALMAAVPLLALSADVDGEGQTTLPSGTMNAPTDSIYTRDAVGPEGDRQKLEAAQSRPLHATNRKALLHAAAFGNLADVQALLKQGANPDARANDAIGRTALILAAAGGHVEIVNALLANGATLDNRDRTGHARLHVLFRMSTVAHCRNMTFVS